MTPNWLATSALLVWPLIAFCLFAMRPVSQAVLWTILGGLLLLPVGAAIKLAVGIPPLDKASVPNLAALMGCIFIARRSIKLSGKVGLAEVLLFVFLFEPLITSELNKDVIFVGGGIILPPVGLYDGLSAVVGQLIFTLPFFLGRQFIRSAEDNARILSALVIAGLLYSLPVLIELRMSPQFHNWLYGYQPSNFDQEVRAEGWRPMVLMGHGLLLAFFLMTAAVAAAALWKARVRVTRFSAASVTGYLSLILLFCKSAGAAVYGFVLIPLVRFTAPKLQLNVAAVLVSLALLYPVLRASDLVPAQSLVGAAATFFNGDRASSLNVRFENEERLLDRASQRFWFGWGRWGRSRVYTDSGRDISLTDGLWLITMGQFGFIGFLAEFSLLALPIFRAVSALKFITSKQEGIYLAALALIVAINTIDLLPNASLSPWTWLLAGALLGRSEELRAAERFRNFAPVSGLGVSTNVAESDLAPLALAAKRSR